MLEFKLVRRRMLAAVVFSMLVLTQAQTAQSQADRKPYLFEQVAEYSKDHPVVVIGVSKGRKDTSITGDQIGTRLSQVLEVQFEVPSKYFVADGGDYTAVIYSVKNHLYGPYSLTEAVTATALVADAFDERVLGKGRRSPPEPKH